MVAGEVEVQVPGPLREYSGGRAAILTPPGTVADVLAALEKECPGIGRRIRDEQGRVRQHVNLFLNEKPVKHLDLGKTEVRAGDRLHILPAISGGR